MHDVIFTVHFYKSSIKSFMIAIHTVLQKHVTKISLYLLMILCGCFFTLIDYGQSATKKIAANNVALAATTSSSRQVTPFDNDWRFLETLCVLKKFDSASQAS